MWKTVFGFLVFIMACGVGVSAQDDECQVKSKALAHYIMAVSHDLNSRPAEAIAEYERSIALNAREPLPHLRLAGYYVRSGLLDKAIPQLKAVLNLDPQSSQAHYLLALVYSSQEKYDLAAVEYEKILKSSAQDQPDSVEIHLYLAQMYYSQKKYPQAIAQFKKILGLDPDNVPVLFSLAGAYLEMNQRSFAKEQFKKVLSLEPENDGALNSLAYIYAEDGDNLDDALKMGHDAVRLDPTNGAYYDTLGWVLFKKGMNSQALMALQKAEGFIQNPIVYDHMGDVYQSLGELALACKSWRKSLELEPHQSNVLAKIGQVEKIVAQSK